MTATATATPAVPAAIFRRNHRFGAGFSWYVKAGIRRAARSEADPNKRAALFALLDDDIALEAVMAEHAEAFADLEDKLERRGRFKASEGGRDWTGFFNALAEFLKTIMPLIMDLIGAFG